MKRPFIVVKLAMDDHDMRFDVPTIGPKTVQVLVEAGGDMIAIEAKKTILLERAETLQIADKHGVVIAAYESGAFDATES